jgi:hypothetical protein
MNMLRRVILGPVVVSLAMSSTFTLWAGLASADEPKPPVSTWSTSSDVAAASPPPSAAPSSSPSSSSAGAPAPVAAPSASTGVAGMPPGSVSGPGVKVARGNGVAVVATDGATDAAWRLAARVYRGPLRPLTLDELHARALVGEAPPPSAPRDVQDLFETRAAIRGEDAVSRRLLASLASSLGVLAIVVVSPGPTGGPAAPATARVYLASNGMFDAARYSEDQASTGSGPWEPTAASLERTLRADAAPAGEPLAATGPTAGPRTEPLKGEPAPADGATPFYKSPWFWGALGAAVLGGGGIYLATRDSGDSSGPMHVQMKVPR